MNLRYSGTKTLVAHSCDLCGKGGADVDGGYLRVFRQSVTPGTVTTRWIDLQGFFCLACSREARRIKRRRYWVIAGMLMWLFFAPIPAAIAGMLTKHLESQGLRMVLMIGILIVVIGGFVAGPLYIRAFNRRRTSRLLGSAADSQARSLAGIASWGLLSEVQILPGSTATSASIPLVARNR